MKFQFLSFVFLLLSIAAQINAGLIVSKTIKEKHFVRGRNATITFTLYNMGDGKLCRCLDNMALHALALEQQHRIHH
jgi:hypothetical protein